jgi:hypothetical protein
VDRVRELTTGAARLPATIETYLVERQLALASELKARTPIYLDSRFWIDLSRAARAGPANRAYPLLQALRSAVEAGRAFCPVSASTFCELLQHADSAARAATAQVVDELSLGVSLLSLDELLLSEVRWLLQKTADIPINPEQVPLWTKVSHSLGSVYPNVGWMSADQLLAVQVATVDMLWSMSLEEMARDLRRPPSSHFKDAATRITLDSRAHAHEATDFAAIYQSEAVGIASLVAPLCARVVREIHPQAAQAPPQADAGELSGYINLVAGALVQDKARRALRSMHVRAALHAIIRLNRSRTFKANDLADIEHAAAGVSYCRAFFTEASLRTALTQPPVKLDQFYGCLVTSDIEEASGFVRLLL